MKKILSVALSLIMLLSAFSSVSVFAADEVVGSVEVSTDVTSDKAIALKNYYGDKFNENFFRIVNFTGGEDIEETRIWALEATSDVDVDFKVARYFAINDLGWQRPKDKFGDNFDTISVKKNQTVTQIVYSIGGASHVFQNGFGHTLGLLLDDSMLTSDANVTLKLVSYDMKANDDGTDYVLDEETKQEFASTEIKFIGPVTFTDDQGNAIESLTGFANILTDMKYDKEPNSDAIKDAVNKAMEDTQNIETVKSALKEKLTNKDAEKLASILDESEVTINSVDFNGYSVEIPYADMADTVENKTYYPVVKAGKEYKAEGKKAYALDIEIGIEGEDTTITNPLVQQKVIVELPVAEGWDTTKEVTVYHGDEVKVENIIAEKVAIKNNKVEFFTKSFSNFTIVGDELVIDEASTTRATSVQLKVEQHSDNENMFDLVLYPVDKKEAIINFAAGDFYVYFNHASTTTLPEPVMKTMAYELNVVEGLQKTNEIPVDGKIGGFTFEVHGKEGSLISAPAGQGIKLAELEVKGKGSFVVGTRNAFYSLEQTNEKYGDEGYIYMEKDENDDAKAEILDWKKDYYVINEKTFDLDILVDFTLGLAKDVDDSKKAADYINVTIELTNDITGDVYTVKVGTGSEEDVTYLDVTYEDEFATADGTITLPANATYSYKVSGAGFRTFRGSVYLDEAKELHVWNNALVSKTQNVITSDDTTAKKVTFLVGDIYEDGIVDIYDLSAVTSYYALGKAITEDKYITYDLNRDGYIDTADIAYVQINYNE